MSTWGGLVDASSAIEHLRKRLKQDLPREVSRGHSTIVATWIYLRTAGGLLSPLCGNVMLNVLDKELKRR